MSILIRREPKLAVFLRGQTMAKYAMVPLTIAILVYVAYQLVEDDVVSLANFATAA